MPDLLGLIIQLLQELNKAQMGWLANTALVLVTVVSLIGYTALVIGYTARVLFSLRVIKLYKVIANLFVTAKSKLAKKFDSPYRTDMSENKVGLWFVFIVFYCYAAFFSLYAFFFLAITTGIAIDGELPAYKTVFAYFCSMLFFTFGLFFKCEGDRALFKLRNRRNTRSNDGEEKRFERTDSSGLMEQ